MKPLLAVLMLLFAAGGAEQKHHYIFVYTVPVVSQYTMTCTTGTFSDCSASYRPEERHNWYSTLSDALQGMNNLQNHSSEWTNGTVVWPIVPTQAASDYSKVIGLYEVNEVPAKLVKVGTAKHPVQKTVEEDVPVMEWQVKP